MSTSPCCAGYKFPHTPGGEIDRTRDQNDYFGLENVASMTALSLASPLADSPDYFAINSAHSTMKPQVHKAAANSISSVSSDTTQIGGLSGDFSLSTETLVEESTPIKSRRDLMLLKLPLPKRISGPMSGSGLFFRETLYEDEENDKSYSAVDTQFSFNRKHESPAVKVPAPAFELPALKTASSILISSIPAPLLPLKKQQTQPSLSIKHELSFVESIKLEQLKRLHYIPALENMRAQILGLSTTISYMSQGEVVSHLEQCAIDPRTSLPDFLVIDIRPFADYVKSHVKGSINVCLPLTLLKRTNFSLKRCINSLPAYEGAVFKNYVYHNNLNLAKHITFNSPVSGRHGLPLIFVYDGVNNSSNLYHMCKKLVDNSCWEMASAPSIFLIDEPFQTLADGHPELVTSGKSEPVDLSTLAVKPVAVESVVCDLPDPSLTINTSGNLPQRRSVRAQSTSGLPTLASLDVSTPNVSNFELPLNLPVTKFKIRHNEELFDVPKNLILEEQFFLADINASELASLPEWLRAVSKDDCQVKQEFVRLEESEKARLNHALSYSAKTESELVTPGGSSEVCPKINCGLDYGHKNRYKDIFLYDHSRVKLHANPLTRHQDCDYINASYLNPLDISDLVSKKDGSESLINGMKFIATQGPLRETIGDFWRCVNNQKCRLVVSLSDEYENGINKCSVFWRSGVYRSGENLVKVNVVKEQSQGNFILRSIEVGVNSQKVHQVLQIHLATWADMSTDVEPLDLLSIVGLKHHILSSIGPTSAYSTLTHCSAGCGRTGVFCAVDSLVNLLDFNDNNCELIDNPVYKIVNNLRRQRILMVQTLRQYYFLYDTLVQYALHGNNVELNNLEIVKEFISLCKDI